MAEDDLGPIIRANMNGFKRLFRDLVTRTEDGHAVSEAAFMKLMVPITSSYCARPNIVEIYNNILLLEIQAGSIYKGLSLQGLIAAICKVAIEIFATPEWIERFPTAIDRLRLTFFFIDGSQLYFKHTPTGLPLDHNLTRNGPKLPTTWRAATNEASKLVEDYLGVESNVRGLLTDKNSSLIPSKPTVPVPQGPDLTVPSTAIQALPKFTSPTLLKMNNNSNEKEEQGVGYRRVNGLLPHTASLHVLRSSSSSSSSSNAAIHHATSASSSHHHSSLSSPKLQKQYSFSSVQGHRPLHPSSTMNITDNNTSLTDETDSILTDDASSVPSSAIFATNVTNNASFAVHGNNHSFTHKVSHLFSSSSVSTNNVLHTLNESQDSIIPVEMTVDELEAFLEDEEYIDDTETIEENNGTTVVSIEAIDARNHLASLTSASSSAAVGKTGSVVSSSNDEGTIVPVVPSTAAATTTVNDSPTLPSNTNTNTTTDDSAASSSPTTWDARHNFEHQRRELASRIATNNDLDVIRGSPGHPHSPLLALVKDAKKRGVRSPHVHQPILNNATFATSIPGTLSINSATVPRPSPSVLSSSTGFTVPHDNSSRSHHPSQSSEDHVSLSRNMRTDDLVITADHLTSPSGTVPPIPSSFPTSVRFADGDDFTTLTDSRPSTSLPRERFAPNRQPSSGNPDSSSTAAIANENPSSTVSLPIPSTVIDGVPFTFPPLSTSSSSSSSFPRTNDNNQALTANELSSSKGPEFISSAFGNSAVSSASSTVILASGAWQKKLRVPPGLTQRQALDHAQAYVMLQQQQQQSTVHGGIPSTEQDGDDFVLSQMLRSTASSSSSSILTLPDPNPLFLNALSFENGVPLQADAILGTAAASNTLHATSASSSKVLTDAVTAHNAEILARTSAYPDVPPGKPAIILHPMRHDGMNPILPSQIEDRSTINLVSHLLHDEEHPLSSTLSSSVSSKASRVVSANNSHIVPVNHLAPIAVTGALGHPPVPPPLTSVLSLSSANTSSSSSASSTSKVKFNGSTVSWNTNIANTNTNTKSLNISSTNDKVLTENDIPSSSTTYPTGTTIGTLPHWAVTEGMVRKALRMDTVKVDTIVQAIFKRYSFFGGHDHSRITMVKGGGSIAELSDDRIENDTEAIKTVRLNQNSFTKFALDAGLIGRGGHGAQDFRRGDIAVVYNEALAKMANVGTHGSFSKLSTAGVPTTVKIWKANSFNYREINRSMLHVGLDYPSFRYALVLAAAKRYGSRTISTDKEDSLTNNANHASTNGSSNDTTRKNVIVYAKDINRSLGYALLTLRHIVPLAIHTGLLASMDEIYRTDKAEGTKNNATANETNSNSGPATTEGSTNIRPIVPVQPLENSRSRSNSVVKIGTDNGGSNTETSNSTISSNNHYIPAPLVRSRAASVESRPIVEDTETQVRDRLQKASKAIENRLFTLTNGTQTSTENEEPALVSPPPPIPMTPGRSSRSNSLVLSPSAVAPSTSLIAAIAKSPSVRSRSSSVASVSNVSNLASVIYAPVLSASAQQSKQVSPEASRTVSPLPSTSTTTVPINDDKDKPELPSVMHHDEDESPVPRLPVTASLWSEVLGQDLRMTHPKDESIPPYSPRSPTAVTVDNARATARTADRVIVISPQHRPPQSQRSRSGSANRQNLSSYASRAGVKAQQYVHAYRILHDLNLLNTTMETTESSSQSHLRLNVDTASLRRPSTGSMHTSDLGAEEVLPYDPASSYPEPVSSKPETISGILGSNNRFKANPWAFRISSPVRKPAWRPVSTTFAAHEQHAHVFQQAEERRIAEHARMQPTDHALHTASSFFAVTTTSLPQLPRSTVSPDKGVDSHTNRLNELALPKAGHNIYQATDAFPDGLPDEKKNGNRTVVNVHRQIQPPHIRIDMADITENGEEKTNRSLSVMDVDALLIQEAIEIANLLKERVAQLPNSSAESLSLSSNITNGSEHPTNTSPPTAPQSPKSSLKIRSPGLVTNSPEVVARVYSYRSRSSSANLSNLSSPREGNEDTVASSSSLSPQDNGTTASDAVPGTNPIPVPEAEPTSSVPTTTIVKEEILFSPSNNTLMHSQTHLPESPGTELSISPFTVTSDHGNVSPTYSKHTEDNTLPSDSPTWSSPASSPNTVVSIPPPVPPVPSSTKPIDSVVQLITYQDALPTLSPPVPILSSASSNNVIVSSVPAPPSPDQAASRHIMWSDDVGTPPPASRIVLPGSLPTSPVMDLPVSLGFVSSTVGSDTTVPLLMQSPTTSTTNTNGNGSNNNANESTPGSNPMNGIITTPVDARVPPPDERDIPSTERAQREWQRRYAINPDNEHDNDTNEGGNIIGSLNATMESVFNGNGTNMYGNNERTQESTVIGSTDTSLNTTDSSFWPIFSPGAPANTPVAERYTFIRAGPGMGNATPGALIAVPRVRENKTATTGTNDNKDNHGNKDNEKMGNGSGTHNSASSSSSSSSSSTTSSTLPANAPFRIHIHAGGVEVQSGNTLMNTITNPGATGVLGTTTHSNNPSAVPGHPLPSLYLPSTVPVGMDHHVTAAATPAATNNTFPRTMENAMGTINTPYTPYPVSSSYPIHPPDTVAPPSTVVTTPLGIATLTGPTVTVPSHNYPLIGSHPSYYPPPSAHTMHPSALHYPSQGQHNLNSTNLSMGIGNVQTTVRLHRSGSVDITTSPPPSSLINAYPTPVSTSPPSSTVPGSSIPGIYPLAATTTHHHAVSSVSSTLLAPHATEPVTYTYFPSSVTYTNESSVANNNHNIYASSMLPSSLTTSLPIVSTPSIFHGSTVPSYPPPPSLVDPPFPYPSSQSLSEPMVPNGPVPGSSVDVVTAVAEEDSHGEEEEEEDDDDDEDYGEDAHILRDSQIIMEVSKSLGTESNAPETVPPTVTMNNSVETSKFPTEDELLNALEAESDKGSYTYDVSPVTVDTVTTEPNDVPPPNHPTTSPIQVPPLSASLLQTSSLPSAPTEQPYDTQSEEEDDDPPEEVPTVAQLLRSIGMSTSPRRPTTANLKFASSGLWNNNHHASSPSSRQG